MEDIENKIVEFLEKYPESDAIDLYLEFGNLEYKKLDIAIARLELKGKIKRHSFPGGGKYEVIH